MFLDQGFTKIELIVAVALIAMLAGTVVPFVHVEIAEAKVQRAERDVAAIAEGVFAFKKTVGDWPSMDATGNFARIRVLLSGAQQPSSNPWSASHGFWTAVSSSTADLLDNHLYLNRPKGQSAQTYATSGKRAWRGPYIEPAHVDPWGRPYLINMLAAWDTDPLEQRRLWILSAGPDGVFQTSVYARRTDDVAGDDIGALLLQR